MSAKRVAFFSKMGMVAGAILMAIMLMGAVTPNSVVTVQGIGGQTTTLATGANTTDVLGASTNGTFVYKVNVYPGASARVCTLLVHNGSAAMSISATSITADTSPEIIPIDILQNVPLPVDSNGNKVLKLKAGWKLQITTDNVAQTQDVVVLADDL